MSDNEIICIINGRQKIYYRVKKIALQYLDYKEAIVRTNGNIPDGSVVEFSPSLRYEKNYLNGKLHGTIKHYDSKTGVLLQSEQYSYGVLNGKRTKFDKNGKVVSIENYKDSLLDGFAKQYYPSGCLRFEDSYDNGKLVSRKEYSDSQESELIQSIDYDKQKPKNIDDTKNQNLQKESSDTSLQKDSAEVFLQNVSQEPEKTKNHTPKTLKHTETVCNHIIRKVTDDCRLYYKANEVVAKEIFNQNGVIIDSIGSIPNGTVKEFYDNGQLKVEETYENNTLNGIRKKYDELGRLWAEETYVDGKLNGVVKIHNYFKDKIFEEEAYFKNDMLNGVRKTFYPNGRVSVEENYENGQFEGVRKSYYENGQVSSEEFYKDGKLEGMRLRYYDNGSLWSEQRYENGKLEGVRKDYYTSGHTRFEEIYKNGRLQGKRKFYFETGKIMYEEVYLDGILQERNEYKNIRSINN